MTFYLDQYPLVIPFAAILAAEVVKATIDLIRRRKRIRFVRPGGMPSGHSALVSALVVVVAFREGVGSTMFMIASVLAVVVMYDAVNLRNQAGLHAKVLNTLAKNADLEESLGHTFPEVLAGAAFGAVFAYGLLTV